MLAHVVHLSLFLPRGLSPAATTVLPAAVVGSHGPNGCSCHVYFVIIYPKKCPITLTWMMTKNDPRTHPILYVIPFGAAGLFRFTKYETSNIVQLALVMTSIGSWRDKHRANVSQII